MGQRLFDSFTEQLDFAAKHGIDPNRRDSLSQLSHAFISHEPRDTDAGTTGPQQNRLHEELTGVLQRSQKPGQK